MAKGVESSRPSIGLVGEAFGADCNIGVLGSVTIPMKQTSSAGIYGTNGSMYMREFAYPGVYAGYFCGSVLATGKIYGSVYSLASVPKSSANAKVQSLGLDSGNEESISDRLLSVQTVQFMREEEVEPVVSAEKETDSSEDMAKSDERQLGTESIRETAKSEVETEMVKHYGLDGEQLKVVFPELVVEDSQGNYRINYPEMVPLLLQSIRELKAEVAELKSEKSSLAKKAKATSIESEGESTDIVRMSQNKPNPFSESSVITLSIPEGTKQAAIYVYDLSGKQVKNIPVDKRGETDITVYASDFSEGMFVYSLVVDGTVASTRRMMVVRN